MATHTPYIESGIIQSLFNKDLVIPEEYLQCKTCSPHDAGDDTTSPLTEGIAMVGLAYATFIEIAVESPDDNKFSNGFMMGVEGENAFAEIPLNTTTDVRRDTMRVKTFLAGLVAGAYARQFNWEVPTHRISPTADIEDDESQHIYIERMTHPAYNYGVAGQFAYQTTVYYSNGDEVITQFYSNSFDKSDSPLITMMTTEMSGTRVEGRTGPLDVPWVINFFQSGQTEIIEVV